MRVVSLFSGIGGFEQALNRLGGSCVMASEIDKYANQAYEVLYGHPTVGERLGRVRGQSIAPSQAGSAALKYVID